MIAEGDVEAQRAGGDSVMDAVAGAPPGLSAPSPSTQALAMKMLQHGATPEKTVEILKQKGLI